MRKTFLALSSLKSDTEYYLEYIRHSDKTLPLLHEIFPKLPAKDTDVTTFHTKLCTTLQENGFYFKGIKVVSPSNETMRSVYGKHPICVPLFTNFFQSKVFSKKKCRLQYVEPVICFKVGEVSESSMTGGCVSFIPAIEVTGTRFPFYPPSVSGFACDLSSCVGFSLGTENKLLSVDFDTLLNHHFVLTHDDEPVQVGSLKLCTDEPLKQIAVAYAYASQLGHPLQKNHLVIFNGVGSQTPARFGDYTFQWGVYGTASCSVVS